MHKRLTRRSRQIMLRKNARTYRTERLVPGGEMLARSEVAGDRVTVRFMLVEQFHRQYTDAHRCQQQHGIQSLQVFLPVFQSGTEYKGTTNPWQSKIGAPASHFYLFACY